MLWNIIITILIGALVGWLAGLIMKTNHGFWIRVLLGIVGSAVGRNPVSLIVPCHRVVGAGGSLGGYAAGPDRKARLLQLEHAGSL